MLAFNLSCITQKKGAGSNSSAVAAFIHPERGFLVYDVFVLDSSNNIHALEFLALMGLLTAVPQ